MSKLATFLQTQTIDDPGAVCSVAELLRRFHIGMTARERRLWPRWHVVLHIRQPVVEVRGVSHFVGLRLLTEGSNNEETLSRQVRDCDPVGVR
jgi:hypothetical protein